MGGGGSPGSYFKNTGGGTINVYYDSEQSDISGDHAFSDGNGWLIAKPSPPAGTIFLMK